MEIPCTFSWSRIADGIPISNLILHFFFYYLSIVFRPLRNTKTQRNKRLGTYKLVIVQRLASLSLYPFYLTVFQTFSISIWNPERVPNSYLLITLLPLFLFPSPISSIYLPTTSIAITFYSYVYISWVSLPVFADSFSRDHIAFFVMFHPPFLNLLIPVSQVLFLIFFCFSYKRSAH